MNRLRLPGAFYTDTHIIPSGSGSGSGSATNHTISPEARESQLKLRFENTQLIHTKTKDQYELLSLLEFISHMIMFYQFIKYCHLACLIPLLLHFASQMILNTKLITHSEDYPQIVSLIMGGDDDENGETTRDRDVQERRESRERMYNSFLHNYCYFLYIKTIIVLIYHALFIGAWVVSVVNSQQLDKLQHGTWWLISFIGESTPSSVTPSTPYFMKLLRLGLGQLLFSDLLILFVQLTLYQCIYKQSDAFHLERRLNEKEVYIIRNQDQSQVGTFDDGSVKVDDEGIPTVLKIRLYECFKPDAYQ